MGLGGRRRRRFRRFRIRRRRWRRGGSERLVALLPFLLSLERCLQMNVWRRLPSPRCIRISHIYSLARMLATHTTHLYHLPPHPARRASYPLEADRTAPHAIFLFTVFRFFRMPPPHDHAHPCSRPAHARTHSRHIYPGLARFAIHVYHPHPHRRLFLVFSLAFLFPVFRLWTRLARPVFHHLPPYHCLYIKSHLRVALSIVLSISRIPRHATILTLISLSSHITLSSSSYNNLHTLYDM
ncbi:hypothetical protein C8J57DRAFT_1391139, partial [Mycena rebaudengoi]